MEIITEVCKTGELNQYARIILGSEQHKYIVFVELDDNPGMSITNAAELCVQRACIDLEMFGPELKKTVFLAHYPSSTSGSIERILVDCDEDGHPVLNGWTPLPKVFQKNIRGLIQPIIAAHKELTDKR